MKKIIYASITLLFSLVLWALPSSQTGNVNIVWVRGYDTNYPTESYFSGSVVYWGTTSRVYTSSVGVNSSVFTNNVAGLVRGATYYFTVSQVGTNGVESDYGPEAVYTVPNKPPKITSISTN